jgi:hypothetical protein
MKRFIGAILTIVIIISIIPSMTHTVSAQNVMEDDFWGILSDGKVTIISYNTFAAGGDVVIPSTLGGYPVTAIGDHAFYTNAKITSVIIPDSVTTIGKEAFQRCTALTSVTIGNGVITIGNSAFYGCTALTSVTLGNSVTTIGTYTFANCTALTSVTFGNSLTHIADRMFYGCTSLKTVNIPESVVLIGEGAFRDCISLTDVTIPKSVTEIHWTAFMEHSHIGFGNYLPLPNLVIHCYSNSAAHEYAISIENWNRFVLLDAPAEPPTPISPIDTASSWARESITTALSKGFIPAEIQNNYTNVITRAEFCRMAIKWVEYATGKSIDTILTERGLSRNPNAFTDTSDPYILAAYALGITIG